MKKKKDSDDHSHLKKFAGKMNLPKDVLLGTTVVTMNGTNEVIIENYKGILDYNDTFVNVQGKHYAIEVTGKDFRIDYFSAYDMKITGTVKKIEYK